MLERRHEALLNGVLGIFPIVGDVLSNSGEIAIVTPCELLESRYISILSGMDKLQSSLALPSLRILPSLQSYSFNCSLRDGKGNRDLE